MHHSCVRATDEAEDGQIMEGSHHHSCLSTTRISDQILFSSNYDSQLNSTVRAKRSLPTRSSSSRKILNHKMTAVALFLVVLTSISMPHVSACNTKYRVPSSTRRRTTKERSLHTPLVFKERMPLGVSELSAAASGVALGPVRNGTREFTKLKTSWNPDIVFRDEERTGEDRLMTQRCKDKLDRLSLMVRNYWSSNIRLRVTEAWDPYRGSNSVYNSISANPTKRANPGKNRADNNAVLSTGDTASMGSNNAHTTDSLHYEGRAVDIMTSDRDRSKLGMLARLAYNAGFDHVYYQGKNHIHCSVKSDIDLSTSSHGGCFSGEAKVHVKGRGVTLLRDIQIGDEVLTDLSYNSPTDTKSGSSAENVSGTSDGGISGDISASATYEPVFMFMDRQPSKSAEFVSITTENGHRIDATPSHLIFVRDNTAVLGRPTLVKFARDIAIGDFLFSSSFPSTDNNTGFHVQSEGYMAISRGKEPRLGVTTEVSRVVAVERVHKRGLYAPVTLGGTVVVDGVVSSCYAHITSHTLAHRALAPARAFYKFSRSVNEALSLVMTVVSEILLGSDVGHRSFEGHRPAEVGEGIHWYCHILLRLLPCVPSEILNFLAS